MRPLRGVLILDSDKPWIKHITANNLPNEDLKLVEAIIGLDATIKLMCELSGVNISIPVNATLPAKNEYILKNYDGTKKSRVALSKLCGLSEGYIYRIIREYRNRKKL